MTLPRAIVSSRRKGYWRTACREVIGEALEFCREMNMTGVCMERYVSDRYPFGQRKGHPYRVWLDEYAKQVRGRKPTRARPQAVAPDPDQLTLFDGAPCDE